jgi:transcriptional regulator
MTFMYQPAHFTVVELDHIHEFVATVASADLVTVDDSGQPLSTLMPCIWKLDESGHGTVYMHMARANKQWETIENGARALAIVHGAQAYVSPSNYATKAEHGKVVPTWNYTSVHLSGTVEVSHDPEYLRGIVRELTDHHERGRSAPWSIDDAPETYMNAQLRGIVAITLHVDRVEAKAKLSQNRSQEDQDGVIIDLSHSTHHEDNAIATLMSSDGNKLIR